jgi:hypothetical protein
VDRMVATITRIKAPLYFLLNPNSFVTVVPKYFNCDKFSNVLWSSFMS